MQNEISKRIDNVVQEADAVFEVWEKLRQALADVKMKKYERRELETGEVVFIPLEVLMDELMQSEVESERFITKLTGRTNKDERAAEIEGWMRQYVPLYSEYFNRLQNQEVQETMANAASAIAEKDYGRLHTKIMALRGQLEFRTSSENTFTKLHEIETVKEQKKVQIEIIEEQKKAHTILLDIARKSCVREQEARNGELALNQVKQKLEEKRAETAKVLAQKASDEKETEKMRVNREVEAVKATASEELEQYKQAVQPLLKLAQSLQELQTPKAQQQLTSEDKYNETLKAGWVTR